MAGPTHSLSRSCFYVKNNLDGGIYEETKKRNVAAMCGHGHGADVYAVLRVGKVKDYAQN